MLPCPRFSRTLLLALSAAALAGCASFEPKPCTTEWVEWKKERVFREFARDNRREIDNLRSLTRTFTRDSDKEDAVASLQLVFAGFGVLRLVGDFAETAAPAIREGVEKCGSAPRTAQLFADLLREEGFDDEAAEAVGRLGVWLDLER